MRNFAYLCPIGAKNGYTSMKIDVQEEFLVFGLKNTDGQKSVGASMIYDLGSI